MRNRIFVVGFAVALAAALAAAGCDEGPDPTAPIADNGTFQGVVGGTETGYESYRGVVGLFYMVTAASGALCTATVIAPQVLLTAGHCVYYPGDGIDAVAEPTKIQVLGGADLMAMAGKVFYPEPEQIVAHPDWDGVISSSMDYVDLAMIKLSEPITTTETYRVRKVDDVSPGDDGVIVGYGLSSSSDQNSAGVHRMGNTSVLNVLYHYLNLGGESGTCQGDSGGPFFAKVGDDGYWYVTGVTSLGLSSECTATSGSVDENVAQQWDWINETMIEFMGYGLDDVVHQDTDGADTDTGTADGDADTDTEDDTGTSDDEDDAGTGGGGGGDDGSCSMAPRAATASLLSAIL